MNAILSAPETIHPALWRGSQLARARGDVIDTGYPELSEQFPGGGWPVSSLIEVLTQQPGSGELRLLAPSLAARKAPIAMVSPPAEPVVAGLAYVGIRPEQLLLLRAQTLSDQLWTAEQVLLAGTCSALLIWQHHVRADSLRRLHLTARSASTLLFMMRPLSAARDASPAELRIAVRPGESGATVQILKRKGPTFEGDLSIELRPSAVLMSPRGRTRRATATPLAQEPESVAIAAATI